MTSRWRVGSISAVFREAIHTGRTLLFYLAKKNETLTLHFIHFSLQSVKAGIVLCVHVCLLGDLVCAIPYGPRRGRRRVCQRNAGSESPSTDARYQSLSSVKEISHLCSCWLYSDTQVNNVFQLWSLEKSRPAGRHRMP